MISAALFHSSEPVKLADRAPHTFFDKIPSCGRAFFENVENEVIFRYTAHTLLLQSKNFEAVTIAAVSALKVRLFSFTGTKPALIINFFSSEVNPP